MFALAISLSALLIFAASPASTFPVAAVLGAAVCGLLIVFVINFIVSLMSVFKMHHGADEYGPEHSRNARLGVMYKWIGTGLSTTAAILVAYLVFGGLSAFFVPGQVPVAVYIPLLVTVIWTAGVSCKGQMYRHMVRALQPPETRRRSDIASLIIPVLGVVALGVVGYATARVVGLIQNPVGLDPLRAIQLSQLLIGGVFLPPGLAVAGYVIFLTVYHPNLPATLPRPCPSVRDHASCLSLGRLSDLAIGQSILPHSRGGAIARSADRYPESPGSLPAGPRLSAGRVRAMSSMRTPECLDRDVLRTLRESAQDLRDGEGASR